VFHATLSLALDVGGPGSDEGRAFIDGQLLAGGKMLAALWITAWRQAAPDTHLQGTLIHR